MSVDMHFIATFLLGIFTGLLGWLGRELWKAVQELRVDLQKLEVMISSDYVRYDRLQDALRPVMDALQQIQEKLDKKADKP